LPVSGNRKGKRDVIEMWVLIQVDNENDTDKKEKRRIILDQEPVLEKIDQIGTVKITGRGRDFHPMTEG
jgi:hypothetical protein